MISICHVKPDEIPAIQCKYSTVILCCESKYLNVWDSQTRIPRLCDS